MSNFLEKIVERTSEGIHHARETAIGILNPNRRHDDPEEKHNDMIRAEINAGHRFDSFADERSQNFVKWHVDGHDYMYALSEMLDSAREAIFILDWWLTPELYLRRPPAFNEQWRLDRILKRKAEQGVKVYVVVYKEVTQTMSMSSSHTKHALEDLHPNIACMRHPDHIGSKDDVEFWSHHEKVVVVDNHRACIGGLDLCFGRWDTHTHPLADVHPTNFANTLFPGQDYNNARVLDFQDVSQYANQGLSVLDVPRMPWHDVHMTLCGSVVLDIVQHFVERWNEVKRRKVLTVFVYGPQLTISGRDRRYDWLALPHDIEASPNEAVVRHPHREQWHAMGRRFKQRFHRQYPEAYPEEEEDPIAISSTINEGPVKNLIAQALVQRIIQAGQSGQKFKVVVVIPEVPGFAGNIKNESSVKIIMAAQYRTINRGGHSIYEEIRKAGFEPMDYIRFYHLRAYDRINAPYPSFIAQIEETSGVKFQQAMVALARQWVGQEDGPSQPQTVSIVLPVENDNNAADVAGTKNDTKTETYPLPRSVDEAREIIERFEHGADNLRSDEDVSDNVVQHMLNDRTSLLDEKWLGTEEEERNAYVSELLYIHSKVMIVDDRRVIMGSANINDRSQKGDGDSEIALVVEDDDLVETQMDGQKYMASRFASSLRRKLYKEHLGLIPPQLCEGPNEEPTSFMRPAPLPNDDETSQAEDEAVADPLSDSTDALWNGTAKKNREIFTEIFRPVPTNLIRNWDAYANYVPKTKTDHVAPDVPLSRIKDRLSQVKGALVECPLDFLIDQHDFVEGPEWSGFDPTLPIYI
ncbi:hypothetical protein PHLCEN_2v82 [Hermanssonia centrifuga]|uniref:phospholipase D n=1 Tax=Hermanssonia centrifuga TaxID=98765 RepID=A0A2R6S781_9APHY|nr:hypothetical protein PHLCEN_2v82 [Hermanssonia centrifuga]